MQVGQRGKSPRLRGDFKRNPEGAQSAAIVSMAVFSDALRKLPESVMTVSGFIKRAPQCRGRLWRQ